MGQWYITGIIIMKKFLMLIAMAGMFFCVNAQSMCKITGGVEATQISSGGTCDEINVTLDNTNSYKVTVYLEVKVVDKEGNEAVRQKTVVIPANKKDKIAKFRTKKVKGETKCADTSQCEVVSMRVEMCE